jgi:hypothetical protein
VPLWCANIFSAPSSANHFRPALVVLNLTAQSSQMESMRSNPAESCGILPIAQSHLLSISPLCHTRKWVQTCVAVLADGSQARLLAVHPKSLKAQRQTVHARIRVHSYLYSLFVVSSKDSWSMHKMHSLEWSDKVRFVYCSERKGSEAASTARQTDVAWPMTENINTKPKSTK